MAVPQSPDDLREHLRENTGFLRHSALTFDSGEKSEAKRMAHVLRTLLHNTNRSRSLLDQLEVQASMKFFDSRGGLIPGNLLTDSSLTQIKISAEGATYVAPLGNTPPDDDGFPVSPHKANEWRPFDEWWAIPVLSDDRGEAFDRGSLVLAVCNKDGGSHVDPHLPETYARLSRQNSLGWMFGSTDQQPIPADNPVPAAIRQIAYEVDVSLAREYPELAPSPDSSNQHPS